MSKDDKQPYWSFRQCKKSLCSLDRIREAIYKTGIVVMLVSGPVMASAFFYCLVNPISSQDEKMNCIIKEPTAVTLKVHGVNRYNLKQHNP